MNTTTVRSVDGQLSSYGDENEKYFNKYHPDYIPGTINILIEGGGKDKNMLKTTKDGIVLHPQPSDSPNDPLNWSWKSKAYQAFLIMFVTAFTGATSNSAGSAQDSLNEIYDISYEAMNSGAGILFLAIGGSTLVLAPVSFLYGRKSTYVICILLGMLGAIWFGYSKRTSDTLWSQLFVGASEGCAEACAQLTLSDMYFSHQLGWAITYYIMAISIGTYLGPLFGGLIAGQNFRWVGWTSAIISGALLVVLVFTQYETYFDRSKYVNADLGDIVDAGYEGLDTIIMREQNEVEVEVEVEVEDQDSNEKNAAVRVLSNSGQSFSSLIGDNGINEKKKSFWKNIALFTPASNLKGWGVKQYFDLLFNMCRVFWFPPVVLSGILWGLQDAFLTFYLTTEDDQYYDAPFNYSNTAVSLMNVPCLIGAMIGCMYAGILSDWAVIWIAKKRGGIHEPEDYLYFLILVFICCPVGMMVFAAGTDQLWSWKITYTLGLGFIGVGWGASGDIAMSYLASAYPDMVMEGMVGVSVINNLIGCIFTFACSPWLDAMGNTNTYAILISCQIVACLLAIPCIIYGKRMRIWTKKSYINFIEKRDGVQREVAVRS